MQTKKITKILIAIIIMLFIIISSTNSFAGGLDPSLLKGTDTGINLDFIRNDITGLIRTIGTFIAVGALMVIGIRYMTGSIEEKANYKKSMMPYVIGCVILFGAANIAPQIIETFQGLGENTENIGNSILGLIQVIGSFIAVGVLMILGVKYMAGSAEARASYKKSMMPYIIGAILLFASVNIVTAIYNAVPSA